MELLIVRDRTACTFGVPTQLSTMMSSRYEMEWNSNSLFEYELHQVR